MGLPRALTGLAREELLRRLVVSMRRARGLPADGDGLDVSLAEVAELVREDDAPGRVYQAVNEPALRAAFRAVRGGRKFAEGEVPAVTQLFTPRWVVEFLVQNTLGRAWREMWPGSRIAMPWLVKEVKDVPRARKSVAEVRVIDPACGTMNFGLVAFDLLREMYREEGWPEDEIGRAILRNNLFGVDVDPVAVAVAREGLAMKAGVDAGAAAAAMNLRAGDALAGVEGTFDVVVTNPPYLSARNLDAGRAAWLKARYPAGRRDLYACFIELAPSLLNDGGRAGLLTMQSFMFTGGFEALRRKVFSAAAVEAVAHFGAGLFDGGNPGTLRTVGFVLRKEPDAGGREGQEVAAYRLSDARGAEGKRAALAGVRPTTVRQGELASGPRAAWNYDASPAARRAFATLPRLKDVAPPRQGLATTDNARFVRYWWELACPPQAAVRPEPGRWWPYAKSGGFARWYERPRHVVDWADDGRAIKAAIVARYPYLNGKWQWVAKNSAYYGRAGVTYSYLTSGPFSARLLPEGCLFDVAGSALFPDDPLPILGVLNSAAARDLLGLINPTVNFQVGDVGELPVPPGLPAGLSVLVGEAVAVRQELERFDETSPDFVRPVAWAGVGEVIEESGAKLARAEAEIDRIVAAAYGLDGDQRNARDLTVDGTEWARRWVSYAVGAVLGRWGGDDARDVAEAGAVEAALARLAGERAAREIAAAVGGVSRFLARGFFAWHVKVYRRRPVYWQLNGRIVAHWAVTPDLLRRIGVEAPAGWRRRVDDGVAANLAPLAGAVREREMRKVLKGAAHALAEGRLGWSATSRDLGGRPVTSTSR